MPPQHAQKQLRPPMWPQEEQDTSSKHMMVSSSSSKSSSSSSSPNPFASAGVPHTPRTMEEVWKDITLSPATPVLDTHCQEPYYQPHDHHHPGGAAHTSTAATTTTTLSHFRGMILQDFLARPFKGTSTAPAAQEGSHCDDAGLLGSPLPLPPHPSPPAIALCLNSGVDFQYLGGCGGSMARSRPGGSRSWHHSHNQSHSTTTGQRHLSSSSPSVVASAFSDSLGSPRPGFLPFCGNKKRNSKPQQQQHLESSDGSGSDRRHKRMIKNRESAARSRARKQAYTNELELELNHLTEENQRLRRQHEELRARIAAQLLPTRKSLHRSSTAPF